MLTVTRYLALFAITTASLGACSSDAAVGDDQPNGGGGSGGDAAGGTGGGANPGGAGSGGDGGDGEPERPGPEYVDLGTAVSGDVLTLDVEPGTLGFHIIVDDEDGPTGREQVGIQVMLSPSGEYATRDNIITGAGFATGSSPYGVVAAQVPQNPLESTMPVEPGQWSFLVAGFERSGEQSTRPMRVAAYIQKTDDGKFHGGELDLHIHLPKGIKVGNPDAAAVISPANAANHPNVVPRIDSFYKALNDLYGIGRGNVFFHEINAMYVETAEGNILNAADKTGAVANGPGMHVVWVENLTASGNRIWGISANNPGAQYETGHPISAVVLNIGAGNGAAADGLTMLHEMGHFVGLFHTSELNYSTFDPLTDTPRCTSSLACPDSQNIMFPTFWGATHGVGLISSAQQRAVVRGSVVYRAYPNDSYNE